MNTITRSESMAVAMPMNTSASALMLSGDSMDKMMRIADFMASAKSTIPMHLRNPGDCLAVVMQATQWNMNPFAVAQKTHVVNGTLGYEAQLVAAVVNNSGLVTDRFNFEWFGDWHKIVGKFKEVESRTKTDDGGKPKKFIVPDWNASDEKGLGVRVWATIKGESEPRVLEILMTQARTRNSTLWTEDPKQQIAYLAQKRWARLYAPDVILGVYTPDELEQSIPRDMGTAEVVSLWTPDQITAADEAAAKGAKAYVAFWKSLGADMQKKLAGTKEHEDFKTQAQRADVERTVDTAPKAAAPAAPAATQAAEAAPAANESTGEIVTTVDDVRKRMEAAKNEDALYVALDWLNAVQQPEQDAARTDLEAFFNTRLAAIRGE